MRPWIERASPTYPCLIDQDHKITELFNISNVPMAVWIDERGRIVRPPEATGIGHSRDKGFMEVFQKGRHDRATGRLTQEGEALLRQVRRPYMDAIADWVERGDESPYVLSPEVTRARMELPERNHAEATAYFRLGRYLFAQGKPADAQRAFQKATELWPESISFLRQWGDLEAPGSMGGERFFKRMREMRERGESLTRRPSDIPGL